MEEDFRHIFYPDDPERETMARLRRLADPGKITYLVNLPGENPFRMVQNKFGQWEFEDRMNAPLSAMHFETELIRVIRENEA